MREPRTRYTEAQAREAIAASKSYAETLRRLGMCQGGGAAVILRKWVRVWGIPVDHFDPHWAARTRGIRPVIPLESVLVEHSTYARGTLKKRLYAEGLKRPQCELCGQGEIWRGRRMALILDHANGVSSDNRLENLRIVCPNCSATLETHCGRNVKLMQERECARCGASFRPRSERQRHCSKDCGIRSDRPQLRQPRPARRKVQRPSYEQLVADVARLSWVAVGRKYGVSDNAVRKWLRWYQRDLEEVDVRKAA
jgi:hypothetical protein